MYFIIYTGDIEKDPNNRGVEYRRTLDGAISFRDIMKNKGYQVQLYQGVQLIN
jgi:hypothetical protein